MNRKLLCVLGLYLLLCHVPFSLARGGGRGGGGKGKGSSSRTTSTSTRSHGSSNTKTSSDTKSGQNNQHGGGGDSYINHNPNNRVLSPRYGGSFGYGGHGGKGGSYFSNSVARSGMGPSTNSLGYGRSAVAAAAGGAMVGMAECYGMERFPHPHFHLRNPHEEYYYNYYMYKKYGIKSTDTNDYSRDYVYSNPPDSYSTHMDSCMKRNDILPAKSKKSTKPKPTITTTTTTGSAAFDTNKTSNTTQTNSTAAESSPESSKEDDDTVSLMEIGYPSLIEQEKVRKCVEMYVDNSHRFLKRWTGGGAGLKVGLHGILAVLTSTLLMLVNSNMLTVLH